MKILRGYAFWPNESKVECGLLFCEDENGKLWTLRSDLALLQLIRSASPEPSQATSRSAARIGRPKVEDLALRPNRTRT